MSHLSVRVINGTVPQECHCETQTHTEVTSCDWMVNLLTRYAIDDHIF